MFRKKWLLYLAAVLCLVGCIDTLPWASLQFIPSHSAVDISAVRLHSIDAALRAYFENHGRLPPAVVTDKEGRPLYSWRVLLLPYLDSGMPRQFRLEEPWDSPHNKRLLEKPFLAYCYPAARDGPGMTRYKAFVGPGTAFERDRIGWDDLAETILVVEAGEPVPWSKPEDFIYDPARPLPRTEGIYQMPAFFLCFYVGQEQGFLGLFGDGRVQFLSNDTDEQTLRRLITSNGSEKSDRSKR